MISIQRVIDSLKECMDPELNIDIWTLELIYGIEVNFDAVKIKMTFTTPACPYGPMLMEQIKEKLSKIEGVKETDIELVFIPQWQPSEDIKALLGVR